MKKPKWRKYRGGWKRGVRPRYAVKGMCAECARDRVAELEGLLGEVRPELNQYNVSLGTLTRIDAALGKGGRDD